jgi:hypothetical protein
MESKMVKFFATKIIFLSKEGDDDFPVKTPVQVTGENRWGERNVCLVWGRANAYLRCWTLNIPECSQESWKIDFVVTFNNGVTYNGAYDLYRTESNNADLADHISRCQAIYLVDYEPCMIKPEEWEERQRRAEDFLDNYALPESEICPETLHKLYALCANYPVIVNYGTQCDPTEFRIRGIHVWVKIEQKYPEKPPAEAYCFSFAFTRDGYYYAFPGNFKSIYEIPQFAFAFLSQINQ